MKPVVLHHETVQEVLQDKLLSTRGITSTLVVCSPKKRFLAQLVPSLSARRPMQGAALEEERAETDGASESTPSHPILDPTLQLISRSKGIMLAFCLRIDTLRAFLSSFAAPGPSSPPPQGSSLLILDLVFLHHATSEFSAQGLMRSLASAVEAAARNHLDLQLCECRDIHDLQNPDRGPRLWDAQVPLLSGSVRLRGEEARWSERTVPARTIAGRWFDFRKKERATDEGANQDTRMILSQS